VGSAEAENDNFDRPDFGYYRAAGTQTTAILQELQHNSDRVRERCRSRREWFCRQFFVLPQPTRFYRRLSVGEAPHLNNIELGRHGRSLSNVWHYAGVNSFRAGRMEELRSHPSAKPVALVADAIKDCTRRGDIVLDTFAGSGTAIMAAERVGRHAPHTGD
jgi:DNA modification methylase